MHLQLGLHCPRCQEEEGRAGHLHRPLVVVPPRRVEAQRPQEGRLYPERVVGPLPTPTSTRSAFTQCRTYCAHLTHFASKFSKT